MGRINNFVSKVIVALLLMLCGFSSGVWAQKVTINQSISLSSNLLKVYPGQSGVLSPSVEAQVNYVASEHFNIYFSIDGVKGSQDAVAGTETFTDPKTGSTVEKYSHSLRIGKKEGSFRVKVTAVPMKGYEDLYQTDTTSFQVLVEKATPTVYLRPYTTIYAYVKNTDNSLGKGVALPKVNDVILIKNSDIPTASDTTDLGKSNFTYSWSVLKGNVRIDNNKLYGTSSKVGDKAQVVCTITPKANVENQYKSVKDTVNVELVAKSNKAITYACYPHNGIHNVFAGWVLSDNPNAFFVLRTPVIIDEDGNDVSASFNCDDTPSSMLLNKEKSTQEEHTYAQLWGKGNNGAGYLLKDGTPTYDVFDVTFSSDDENYKSAVGTYTVRNTPRIPTITFNPDPSTIDFRTGFLLTYLNRFKPKGVWTDPTNGKTYNLVYQGEPKGQNDYTFYYYFAIKCSDIDGNKIQYWASENGGALAPQTVDKILNQATVVEINGVKYYEFNTKNGWGNDNTWNIFINEPTKFNIYYRFAMDWTAVWTFKSDYTSLVLDIKQLVKTKMTLDPYYTVAEEKDKVPAPKVSIVTLDGDTKDHQVADPSEMNLKDFFDIKYSIISDNTNESSINSKTGEVTVGNVKGNDEGEIQVLVQAVPKKSTAGTDFALYNSAGQLMGNPYDVNQAVYTIKIDPYYRKYFEIINDKSEGCKDSVVGKLHFVKVEKNLPNTHNFFPGTSFKGIPGLNVTLGDGVYAQKNLLSGYYTFNIESGLGVSKDDDLDNASYYVTVPATNQKDTLIASRPTNAIVLKPYTNGFFTIDYYYNNGNNGNGIVNLVLADSKGVILKEMSNKENKKNSFGGNTFKAALLAGKTYYLYAKGTNNTYKVHGMNYQPAFVLNEGDEKATTTASVFTNGFMGGIPTIINGETEYVALTSSNTNVATVAQDGTVTPNGHDGTTTIKATVTSAVEYITKTPSYKLSLRTIPYYKVLSQKDENKVKKNGAKHTYGNELVGDTVTTRNYATDITMTFGGVKSYTNPYIENGSAKDSWAEPATDAIGGEIDGFDLFTKGAKDVSDEKYKSYPLYSYKADNSGANNIFTLPVHGAFVKFEPRESGTLIVYLLQNGVCDFQEDTSKGWTVNGSNLWQAKWRPLYIVDQTGKPVVMNNSFQLDNHMLNGVEYSGSYTTGRVLSDCNDEQVKSYINSNASVKSSAKLLPNSTFDWSKFISWYSEDSKDQEQAVENAENMANKIISEWNKKKVGDAQDLIRLGNGSFLTLHKSFVRYSFDVEAGKTYYIFQYKSKIAPCGFSFLPDGWDPSVSMETRQNSRPTVDLYDTKDNEYSKNVKTGSNYNARLVDRTFKNDKWGSICLPFSVSQREFYRVFGDKAMIVTYDSVEYKGLSSIARFTQHDYHMIEAGRPYFLKPTKDVDEVIFKHITFDNPEPQYFYVSHDQDNWYHFKGTYDYTRMAKYAYTTNKLGMLTRYTADGGAYIKGFRAYLDYTGTEAEAKSARLTFYEDDEITAIPSIEVNGVEEITNYNNKIYNVQGQYLGDNLTNLRPGFYIKNGRKIVVK